MSNQDYGAHPQWAFPFNPENAEGVDREAAERLHKALLQESLYDLRNGNVSSGRRRSLWEWFFDVLVRDEPEAGTFKACCACIDAHPFSFLKALVLMHRAEVAELFGRKAVDAIVAKCDDATEIREDDLVSSCATWRNSPRGIDYGRMH